MGEGNDGANPEPVLCSPQLSEERQMEISVTCCTVSHTILELCMKTIMPLCRIIVMSAINQEGILKNRTRWKLTCQSQCQPHTTVTTLAGVWIKDLPEDYLLYVCAHLSGFSGTVNSADTGCEYNKQVKWCCCKTSHKWHLSNLGFF